MASPERHPNMTESPGIELQDIRPNPPSRQLSSETQHRAPRASQAWKAFSHIIRKVLPDPATRRTRRHEPALETATELHPECPQFQVDYNHLRDRPCAPVESLFHLIVVRPPDVLNVIECHPGDKTCLSDWLESIHEALVMESSDSLMLCSLTAENPKSNCGLRYRYLLCLPSQVRHRREVPRRGLIYLLSQRSDWHLSKDVVQELAKADTPPEVEQYQGLRSERSIESCIRVLSKDCISITLRWVCTAPKYKGKIDAYIWQPFRKPPPFAYVQIFVSNLEDPRNLRMLLLFQNKDSRTSFQESYAQSRDFTGGVTWSPTLDGLFAIKIAYKHALREISEFLRQASKQIIALTFESRDDPSKLKMQYLIHLKDCFKRVPPDLQQNLAQLQEVVEKLRPFINEGARFDGDLSDLQIDSDHILADLTKLKRETDDLVLEIESQRRFENSDTLTFLAVLYVPLSFVTSFMGMLLTDASAPPASQISSTSSTLTSSQPANVTYNTTSPASSPGPKLWNMKMFLYLAGSLLLGTVIMPLISGTLIRFIVKTYTHLVPWTHLVSAILGLSCVIFLNTYPEIVDGNLKHCFDAAAVAVVIYVTYCAFLKRVGRLLHIGLLAVIVVCFVLDWFEKIPIPLSETVAWAVFIFEFSCKYGEGKFIRNRHPKTETAESG